MAKLYIGTSGFSYQDWKKGVFYPQDLAPAGQLEYYSRHFKTVELNSPFYRLPKAETFANWRQRTPQNFIFAVKASRYLTHIKKLKDPQEPWQRFIDNAKGLKEKLGPILFQLPPNWSADKSRLENFLKILPKKYSCTFEFRDKSWFNKEIYRLLEKYRTALCLADSKKWPFKEEITADFVYLRLHGPGSLYASDYSSQQLKNWAKKIKKWQKQKKDVFVYFNNDFKGYAVKNARTLKSYLE